jgi:outer membrane protein assembly factor BamE (lipoprotein component of BamABCDE complex)
MNRFLLLLCMLLLLAGCSPAARSEKSFDEIRMLVAGKTEAEVTSLLGNPDHREKLPFGDERWTWWNYTYLGGKEWAPEVRGKIVHLEITFAGPLVAPAGDDEPSRWRVSEPYGVGFSLPGALESMSTLNKTPAAASKGF